MNFVKPLSAVLLLLGSSNALALNYEPTVLESSSQVNQLFSKMPEGFKEEGGFRSESQCFHRAEIWTYDFHLNQHIEAMKVFVFYTFAFRKAYFQATGYPFDWWFHVAPYVIAKNATTGKTDEWVMDKTYLEKPTDIGTWSNLFATLHLRCDDNHENCTMQRFADDKPCAENIPYSQFINEVQSSNPVYGKEYCYVVRMPAPVFHPENIPAVESGEIKDFTFDKGQILTALQSAPNRQSRNFFYRLLGF